MPRLPRFAFAAALTLAALALPAAAADESLPDPRTPGLDGGERLDALVERVKIEQQEVATLEAHFVQRQESTFLLQPEESAGLFSYAAPQQVRWEYEQPEPITVLIDGGAMTTWYHDLGQAEEMKVGRYTERILKYLGASGSLATLLEYFDVRAAFPDDPTLPYRLEMTPKFSRIARRLKSMTIWIDPELFLPYRLRYQAGDGDVTELEFDQVRINGELPAERFRLDLPESVDVRVVDLENSNQANGS